MEELFLYKIFNLINYDYFCNINCKYYESEYTIGRTHATKVA